ncbi:hypothetical protein DFH11DRAFT_1727040 [Phellopilus nigrolimitatus]|nr:hypothetical protein DFH11DRAFT_1727040 [Phellopilus nigrolimitatus]
MDDPIPTLLQDTDDPIPTPLQDMDNDIPKRSSKTRRRNANTKGRSQRRRNEEEQCRKEEEQCREEDERAKELARKREENRVEEEKISALLIYCRRQFMADMPNLPLYPHIVEERPHIITILQEEELQTRMPLSRKSIDDEVPDFDWLTEPGLHIGLTKEGEFRFASKIHGPEFSLKEDADIMQKCLTKLMKISAAMPKITKNAAHAQSRLDKEGVETKSEGVMKVPAGHHASQEKGKSVVHYAPIDTLTAARSLDEWMRLGEAEFIEKFYTYRLALISPMCLHNFVTIGIKHSLPPFGQTDFNGSNAGFPFAGNLAVTYDNFSNLLHRDGDISDYAFGIWWNAEKDARTKEYTPHFTADAAKKTEGGAFLFAIYGYGVDFEKCPNVVENIWRGSRDMHCTLHSTSSGTWTRFGTSTQTSRVLAKRTEALANMPPEDRDSKVISGLTRNASTILSRPSPLQQIPLDLVQSALMAPAANAHCNYERLETLGDAILKFVTSVRLLAEHPHWPEGFLTKRKDHAVSNAYLAQSAIG